MRYLRSQSECFFRSDGGAFRSQLQRLACIIPMYIVVGVVASVFRRVGWSLRVFICVCAFKCDCLRVLGSTASRLAHLRHWWQRWSRRVPRLRDLRCSAFFVLKCFRCTIHVWFLVLRRQSWETYRGFGGGRYLSTVCLTTLAYSQLRSSCMFSMQNLK